MIRSNIWILSSSKCNKENENMNFRVCVYRRLYHLLLMLAVCTMSRISIRSFIPLWQYNIKSKGAQCIKSLVVSFNNITM